MYYDTRNVGTDDHEAVDIYGADAIKGHMRFGDFFTMDCHQYANDLGLF
jgi:hypothetical protein